MIGAMKNRRQTTQVDKIKNSVLVNFDVPQSFLEWDDGLLIFSTHLEMCENHLKSYQL